MHVDKDVAAGGCLALTVAVGIAEDKGYLLYVLRSVLDTEI